MTTNVFLRCSLGLTMAGFAWGQVKPPTTGTPTAPPTTRPTTTPTNPNTNSTPDMNRPLYLSGKVTLDDGTPPSEPVTIQLNCGTRVRSVGYTEVSKGTFSVDINNKLSMASMSDASQDSFDRRAGTSSGNPFGSTMSSPGGQGTQDTFGDRALMGCDLQAALPGFRSDVIHLGNRRSMDNPEVGVIVLRRLANVEGLTISATSAMAPKDAKKALEKGHEYLKKGKWDEAEKSFEKALEIYPKYAAAWYELGRLQAEAKNLEAARRSFVQAVAIDSKFVTPYLELAVLSANEKNWKDVAYNTDRLLHLNPVDFPQAYFFNSLANYYLKNFDAAEKTAREGITHDTVHQYPKMIQVLGVLLAQKQDYAGAAEQLRDYLRFADPASTDLETVKKQLAAIEKVLPEAPAKQQ